MQWQKRTLLSLSAVTAFGLVILFLVPLVPFSTSIAIPGNYEPGVDSCNLIKQTNATQGAKYQQCLANYLYPAAELNGSSTISYKLLGLGSPPYPREKLVTQGNDSALVYFKGDSIEAAENYPSFPITSLNPPGLVTIGNASLHLDPNDFLNFSAVVVNISPEPMTLHARIQGPAAFSTNLTINGVTWMGGGSIGCYRILAPKSTCVASTPSLNSTGGDLTQLHFTVEVLGQIGEQRFLYQQHFALTNPYTGHVNAEWVAAFIRAVNNARNGTGLKEDKTLDGFAQVRFQTSISNFTIANYGFNPDYNKFFSPPAPQVGEATLFVGKYLPTQYVAVLQSTAPGHWAILTDPTYTKFGYFAGVGATVVAREPCAVTEFPSAGINTTQYLTSHGCAYDIVQGPWVVIEVGN